MQKEAWEDVQILGESTTAVRKRRGGNNSPAVWVTRDGVRIPVRNMEDSHLQNAAALMVRLKSEYGETYLAELRKLRDIMDSGDVLVRTEEVGGLCEKVMNIAARLSHWSDRALVLAEEWDRRVALAESRNAVWDHPLFSTAFPARRPAESKRTEDTDSALDGESVYRESREEHDPFVEEEEEQTLTLTEEASDLLERERRKDILGASHPDNVIGLIDVCQ